MNRDLVMMMMMVLMMMMTMNNIIKQSTRPRRAFGKRPPAPRINRDFK